MSSYGDIVNPREVNRLHEGEKFYGQSQESHRKRLRKSVGVLAGSTAVLGLGVGVEIGSVTQDSDIAKGLGAVAILAGAAWVAAKVHGVREDFNAYLWAHGLHDRYNSELEKTQKNLK